MNSPIQLKEYYNQHSTASTWLKHRHYTAPALSSDFLQGTYDTWCYLNSIGVQQLLHCSSTGTLYKCIITTIYSSKKQFFKTFTNLHVNLAIINVRLRTILPNCLHLGLGIINYLCVAGLRTSLSSFSVEYGCSLVLIRR